MKDNEEKWAGRVRAWRESGLSAKAFADGQDYEASTLRFWSSKLKRPAAAAVTLVEVPRSTGGDRAIARPELVLEIGAARLRLATGFDRKLLREVLDALAERS